MARLKGRSRDTQYVHAIVRAACPEGRPLWAEPGDATPRTCRPLGDWSAVQVFAYLQQRRLPVHPAYAMSHGGRHDRRWLRVHSLGGVTGADRGRADWESHYYGDVIRGSRERDSVLAAAPQSRVRAATVTEIAMAAGVPVVVAGRIHPRASERLPLRPARRHGPLLARFPLAHVAQVGSLRCAHSW